MTSYMASNVIDMVKTIDKVFELTCMTEDQIHIIESADMEPCKKILLLSRVEEKFQKQLDELNRLLVRLHDVLIFISTEDEVDEDTKKGINEVVKKLKKYSSVHKKAHDKRMCDTYDKCICENVL